MALLCVHLARVNVLYSVQVKPLRMFQLRRYTQQWQRHSRLGMFALPTAGMPCMDGRMYAVLCTGDECRCIGVVCSLSFQMHGVRWAIQFVPTVFTRRTPARALPMPPTYILLPAGQ